MQSIGERLEEARKRKGISIREAAEATKIRGDYLHKFESNQYDIKLPEIYVRGFLRTYANYLKLPGEKIINDYNGLGHHESAKQRGGLNREIYGRMDLSVSSGKAEKNSAETAATTPATDATAPAETAPRNPATFAPHGGGAISLDKKLLIKFSAIAVGAILVLVVLIWALFGRGGDRSPATANPPELWVKPLAGEASLTLIAKSTVNVSVIATRDGSTIYQGTLPLGDQRIIARRGALRVNADPYQNLEFEIDGRRFPMPNQRTAEIRAP
jgi:transcriptional regulator with XRE-family HTH domain